ncbi:WG repeat-containing protein [Canicola haemoglobinophilus]|nr:WG repeat-containing protein [Canicola haemoglobinophilus]
MKIFRSLVIFSPFLLSACLDDSLSKCQERLSKGMDLIALPYCEKAADGGDASAQELFAKLLLKRGDTERAVEYFGKSANQKNASAMLALAEYYEVVDPEKALFYYKRACAANELKACEKEERLTRKQQQQSQQEALALEKAKAETAALEKEKLAVEKEKLAAQIKAEELRRQKEKEQALKQKIGNRKFYNGLAKYKEGDLWGHINQKGEMVIPAQFAYAADFYDGLAAVKTTEGKWGYIYPSGNYAISPQFSCVIYFNEGLAAVTNEGYGQNCEGGKWGFIDKSGNWVIAPVLDRVETVFRNGVAKVIYNGVTGYINKQGQWIDIPTNTNGSNYAW